jgi:hypothetical protein
MGIIAYRPARGYGASLNGDAQLEDIDLQDADLTQPGAVLRGPGARELAARVHESGGTETALDPSGGQALFWRPDAAGDELCLVHDDTLYTSKPTEVTVNGTQAWREVGSWAPWTLRQQALHQAINFVLDADVATIRDAATGAIYHVLVWEQGNTGVFGKAATPGVWAMTVDESGGIVAPATLIDSGTTKVNPRACACDTGVVIMWHDTATATWMGSSWRLSNPIEFTAATALVAGSAGTAPLFDLRKDGSNDQVIAVLADSVGAFSLPLRLVTVSLVVTSLGAVAVVQAPSIGVSVDVDPLGGYLLTWASATNASAVHVDNTGAVDTVIATVVTANPPVRVTGCHVDGVASTGTIAVEQRVGASQDFRGHVQTFSYNGAALASVRTQRGAILWGHAIVYRGRPVAWQEHFVNDGLQQGVQLLSDLLTGDVLARAFGVQGMGTSDSKGTLYTQPSTPHEVAGILYQAAATVSATLGSTIVLPDSVAVTRVDGAPTPRNPATVPGYALDAMAGLPFLFDGAEAVEADWSVLPSIQSVSTGGAGTGSLSAGTYTIAITYKRVARDGSWWRSAPATASVAAVVNTGSITPTVTPCRWTAKREVIVEVWRSLVNQGSPLYLERQYISDKTVDAQSGAATTQITTADATVATRLQLDQFEPTAVLGHGRTQVTDYMSNGLRRFWSPDPQRPDIIRHTIAHEIDRDGFGWGWEDNQIVQLDTSVRAQAMGPIDGPSLAVLAGDVCHLVYGLGPDKQGSGLFGQVDKFAVVDLETSQPLTASVPDSAIPGGLAYATPRGLFILRRDRVSQMLSAQVDRLFRFDGVEPQAVAYAPTYGELFVMTGTAEARSLRLSLTTGRWCADSARRAQDVAVSARGTVAWLLPDVRVRILDATLIADGDDDLAFRGETPTIRVADNVSQTGTVQALLLHVHVLTAPVALDLSIVDARTGDVVPLAQQTFTAIGRQSRSVNMINLPTYGHRIQWSQPAGNTGRIVLIEMDHQVAPADGVVARTATPL